MLRAAKTTSDRVHVTFSTYAAFAGSLAWLSTLRLWMPSVWPGTGKNVSRTATSRSVGV